MDEMIIETYEGDKPYIFISYCHSDKERVYPIIYFLQREGYKVWFDQGINPGEDWPEIIAEHLDKSAVVMALLSNQSMQSHNCRREFNFAIMENKVMLVVILEDIAFTPVMKMQMSSVQAIYYEEFEDEKSFLNKLGTVSLLKKCKEEQKNESKRGKQFFLKRKFTGEKIYISKEEFKIGRKEKLCDYAVSDNKTVSGVHAIFYQKANKCWVVDNISTNHIYINDEKIPVGDKIKLKHDDLIEMGSEKFIFMEEEEL